MVKVGILISMVSSMFLTGCALFKGDAVETKGLDPVERASCYGVKTPEPVPDYYICRDGVLHCILGARGGLQCFPVEG